VVEVDVRAQQEERPETPVVGGKSARDEMVPKGYGHRDVPTARTARRFDGPPLGDVQGPLDANRTTLESEQLWLHVGRQLDEVPVRVAEVEGCDPEGERAAAGSEDHLGHPQDARVEADGVLDRYDCEDKVVEPCEGRCRGRFDRDTVVVAFHRAGGVARPARQRTRWRVELVMTRFGRLSRVRAGETIQERVDAFMPDDGTTHRFRHR